MKHSVELIDLFADLVVGRDDAQSLAEGTLDIVLSLYGGRAAAIFIPDHEHLKLFASRGIDQGALDTIHALWSASREALERGEEAFSVRDRAADRQFENVKGNGEGAAGFALIPAFDGGKLVALLYLDGPDPQPEPHPCTNHDLERLASFSPIVAKCVADAAPVEARARSTAQAWETYLERTPVKDMEREKLLLLLSRNEWNIARVARLMGVTRRTVYLRLQQYKIPRERVRKTRQPAAML